MATIWYIGCAVWLANAWLAGFYTRSRAQAAVSLVLAAVFLAAGLYFRPRNS
ncbi:hypothetical protein [Terriglobus tenax]|uniref:hypothetical protein n=1 Tax=Terriglobus tenax TaxID=1111115 RepID=UPI0021E0B2A7|nr:hypothetical protein [Terriglobus tenax]